MCVLKWMYAPENVRHLTKKLVCVCVWVTMCVGVRVFVCLYVCVRERQTERAWVWSTATVCASQHMYCVCASVCKCVHVCASVCMCVNLPTGGVYGREKEWEMVDIELFKEEKLKKSMSKNFNLLTKCFKRSQHSALRLKHYLEIMLTSFWACGQNFSLFCQSQV